MIKEIDRSTFEEDLKDGPVLVFFYSKICGPCKMLGFIIDNIDKELGDDLAVIRIDFEEHGDLVEEYGVEGYPTLVMFKDGEEIDRKSGLQQKPVIEKMVKEAF